MLALTKGIIMDLDTNNERQRKFQTKMYDAGFKRISFWVKKGSLRNTLNISMDVFTKRAEKLLSEFKPDERGKLLALLIKILEGKKEVLKLRKKEKTKMLEVKGGDKGRG